MNCLVKIWCAVFILLVGCGGAPEQAADVVTVPPSDPPVLATDAGSENDAVAVMPVVVAPVEASAPIVEPVTDDAGNDAGVAAQDDAGSVVVDAGQPTEDAGPPLANGCYVTQVTGQTATGPGFYQTCCNQADWPAAQGQPGLPTCAQFYAPQIAVGPMFTNTCGAPSCPVGQGCTVNIGGYQGFGTCFAGKP